MISLTTPSELGNHVRSIVSVIGIVVDALAPRKGKKGSDYFCKITLKDESGVSAPFAIFKDSLDKIPSKFSVGDILILNGVKIEIYLGSVQGISTHGFSAFVVDADGRKAKNACINCSEIPKVMPSSDFEKFFKAPAQKLLRWIGDAVQGVESQSKPIVSSNSRKRNIKQLCEIDRQNTFFDWVAMVRGFILAIVLSFLTYVLQLGGINRRKASL